MKKSSSTKNNVIILPESLINKIAAGEVVERPASVVKELLENAIDAGATEIQVSIKNGGKDLISILDNGCGMNESDAQLSVERHATSKIIDEEDLFRIRTLGFRGEALASIAA
ncbi:MAG TPA: DNA mismatch repair protein, partial [Deltaproteobacteria bacterium]|nr:DNA mismatch repair protein [Deltaproteobacteria bacterium]